MVVAWSHSMGRSINPSIVLFLAALVSSQPVILPPEATVDEIVIGLVVLVMVSLKPSICFA